MAADQASTPAKRITARDLKDAFADKPPEWLAQKAEGLLQEAHLFLTVLGARPGPVGAVALQTNPNVARALQHVRKATAAA